MQASRGFTLIELMIVVAIIAILSSIAVSVYGNATAKAQLSEAFTSADGLKIDVLSYYHETGSCPTNGNNGIMAAGSYSGRYVANSTVSPAGSTCMITVQLRNNTVSPYLRGKQVVFTMTAASGSAAIPWTCSSNIALAYLPLTCR